MFLLFISTLCLTRLLFTYIVYVTVSLKIKFVSAKVYLSSLLIGECVDGLSRLAGESFTELPQDNLPYQIYLGYILCQSLQNSKSYRTLEKQISACSQISPSQVTFALFP